MLVKRPFVINQQFVGLKNLDKECCHWIRDILRYKWDIKHLGFVQAMSLACHTALVMLSYYKRWKMTPRLEKIGDMGKKFRSIQKRKKSAKFSY